MRPTARIPTLGALQRQAAVLAAAAALTLAFAGPTEGRHAPAFGLFIDLANRGDVAPVTDEMGNR